MRPARRQRPFDGRTRSSVGHAAILAGRPIPGKGQQYIDGAGLAGLCHDRLYRDGVTKPATDDAATPRGARRRAQLVAAGLELLIDQGFSAVTARAVAERAGTHPALLHHHFGGLPAFRRAVAAAAVRDAFEPAIALLTAAGSWQAGIAAVVRRADEDDDLATRRVTAELIAAALQDEEVADLLRRTLAETRSRVVPWLVAQGVEHPKELATLLVALLDGLLLHKLLEPSLDLAAAADAAAAIPGPAAATSRGR